MACIQTHKTEVSAPNNMLECCMLLLPCTFLQSTYLPINALNKLQYNSNHKLQFITCIEPLHVSANKCPCTIHYMSLLCRNKSEFDTCHEYYFMIYILLHFIECICWLICCKEPLVRLTAGLLEKWEFQIISPIKLKFLMITCIPSCGEIQS